MRLSLVDALTGVSGVHVTPYQPDGQVDYERVSEVAARIAAAGVHCIVTGGNTGEYFALSRHEIAEIRRAAISGVAGSAAVLAGISGSVEEAVASSRDAARAGADAVMLHQPADPFAAPIGVVAYIEQVASASALPVVAYVRSESLDILHLQQLAVIPNLAGVKYAVRDPGKLAGAVRATAGTGLLWICGLAESWAPAFYAVGARGFTSGLVNVAPELSLAIWNTLEVGDLAAAAKELSQLQEFEAMRNEACGGANVTVVKSAMDMIGLPVGMVRPPGLKALDEAARARLSGVLEAWGKVGSASRSTSDGK